jgi:hypothetical protein
MKPYRKTKNKKRNKKIRGGLFTTLSNWSKRASVAATVGANLVGIKTGSNHGYGKIVGHTSFSPIAINPSQRMNPYAQGMAQGITQKPNQAPSSLSQAQNIFSAGKKLISANKTNKLLKKGENLLNSGKDILNKGQSLLNTGAKMLSSKNSTSVTNNPVPPNPVTSNINKPINNPVKNKTSNIGKNNPNNKR